LFSPKSLIALALVNPPTLEIWKRENREIIEKKKRDKIEDIEMMTVSVPSD
jgi:hypothetical protein